MPRTGNKEINKIPIALVPIGLLLVAAVCRADAEDAIAGCAASSSSDLRIACLEDALRALEGSGAAESAASSAEPEPEGSVTPAIDLGKEQVEAPDRASSGEDGKVVNATVVDFRFVGYRRLLVQLDNGQVWRQIDGDRTTVQAGLRNKSSFPVELRGASLGGYRMRIIPLNRTIRVERVR